VLGDVRRLPFADGAFDKAYALDVFEHLSRETLVVVMAEIARVVKPGGRVFAYSHVRKNSRLAGGLRAINRLAHGLERAGLIDLRQERLRKADHVNPLADIPDLERVVSAAGFRIARIRYYTPLLGAFVENILMRLAERALARRASKGASRRSAERAGGSAEGKDRSGAGDAEAALRAARTAAKRRLTVRGPLYHALRAVTWVMTWDVRLLGRVRSGPFFALLERTSSAADADARRGDPVG
jgi:SAM-dependent methyltransferase